MATYVRVQFMLTREQHRALRDLARARGLSMSGLVREILDEALERQRAHLLERQRRALEEARRFVNALAERHGVVSGEAVVREMRAMREERHVL